jgi:hypothetical protein
MRKIPTLFQRDPDQPALITREVHPDCQWVLDGEGTPTRKLDGTCMGYFPAVRGEVRVRGGIGSSEVTEPSDVTGVWLARREVKANQSAPDGFIVEQEDELTGKAVGWVPAEQSPFHKYFTEALPRIGCSPYFGTYELCGPKVNGNPEKLAVHHLFRHHDAERLAGVPRDFDGLITWLLRQTIEGVVWHAADGAMAKLKVRDARAYVNAHREADAS